MEYEEMNFRDLIYGGLSIGDVVLGSLSLLAIIVIIVVFAVLDVLADGLSDVIAQGPSADIMTMIVCIGLVVLAFRRIYRRLNRPRNNS